AHLQTGRLDAQYLLVRADPVDAGGVVPAEVLAGDLRGVGAGGGGDTGRRSGVVRPRPAAVGVAVSGVVRREVAIHLCAVDIHPEDRVVAVGAAAGAVDAGPLEEDLDVGFPVGGEGDRQDRGLGAVPGEVAGPGGDDRR